MWFLHCFWHKSEWTRPEKNNNNNKIWRENPNKYNNPKIALFVCKQLELMDGKKEEENICLCHISHGNSNGQNKKLNIYVLWARVCGREQEREGGKREEQRERERVRVASRFPSGIANILQTAVRVMGIFTCSICVWALTCVWRVNKNHISRLTANVGQKANGN